MDLRPPLELITGDAPLKERSDDELMLLSSANRKDAFGILVDRFLSRVTHYCAKFLGNPRVGEEVAQEVFLQAWTLRREYKPAGRFEVFLFTLARNRCKNHLRDAGRRAKWNAGTGMDGVAATVAAPGADRMLDALVEQENQRRVRDALLTLPDKLREAVLLRFDQGLDYAAIGKIIRRPEATARSRVFHAIKKLREKLDGGDR